MKTLASLFDKSDDVSAYYIENKIPELDPKYFDRIQQFLVETKNYNEKLNYCRKYYKNNDNSFPILVEQDLPPCLISSSKLGIDLLKCWNEL